MALFSHVASSRYIKGCESGDLAAVEAWSLNWNSVLDPKITPVLDDDEAKAVVKKNFGL